MFTPMTVDTEAEECSACHSEVVDGFARNVHAAVDERWAARNEYVGSCSACHGDASAHLDEGGGDGGELHGRDTTPHTPLPNRLGCAGGLTTPEVIAEKSRV